MEEHTFVTVNGLRVKIKMSYHIISIPLCFINTLFAVKNCIFCINVSDINRIVHGCLGI